MPCPLPPPTTITSRNETARQAHCTATAPKAIGGKRQGQGSGKPVNMSSFKWTEDRENRRKRCAGETLPHQADGGNSTGQSSTTVKPQVQEENHTRPSAGRRMTKTHNNKRPAARESIKLNGPGIYHPRPGSLLPSPSPGGPAWSQGVL